MGTPAGKRAHAEVRSQIPPEAGEPGMAPITTGLGEIYQYVVGTAPGYEDQYDARELRSIQDWIVRRQLLGTPGVADVSSFGGYLKQYEIAFRPAQLNAMNVSISDVFEALEANNENTGGAYIERNENALFIRSEGLVGSLDDIRNIAIKTTENGSPVLIRNVATVNLGSAVRYGATTHNGQGEVVSGIAMMLKGENSASVIANIKDRIAEIRETLPEGVTIEPFLDRTELIDRAIGTVTKNLIEGALIVIFILLLLLGNVRAGLIVASVIPLALLFAFGMMRLFGVSGNLMSLGAIDFGLIVDGAVIIVEATMHHLGLRKSRHRLSQKEMDSEVYESASKIRNSAAFGEIIILIVYLPILALVGTEGKMFRPMAQTVSFAILGAFILSLTYVPMISALFLSKKISDKKTISDRIMDFFQRLYTPLIHGAMRFRGMVIVLAVLLFGMALWVFSTLGGEFIPTLDEGDFAVETRVMTGSSLETTIKATTQAEKKLLAAFPEVKSVVSKIGSGEIPTDPMPPEAADMMVILKDRDEWVSAGSKEELVAKMGEVLEEIPGVTFGFMQPIEMRFNELMTGVKQDVAIKIYGEDLTELSRYADQIGRIAQEVPGAEDVYVEEVTGIPQIVINYDRGQLARYGISIRDVNRAVQASFAGAKAGTVYEGERRFDLVLRLDVANRSGLEDVKNIFLTRKDGHQVPLSQVANVEIKDGPYQIQRDDTRRRIIVAFNVRDRDVESTVTDIENRIDESVVLAPGYSVTYGGQFENLIEAKKRLAIAVPLALLLIFVLLYFTFGSLMQGLLIFTAIPLSAIGGVLALWLRGMPFSISAGVGFIALFGVAVLNGIVLIAEFNSLKKEGMMDIFERIYSGTRNRLRPVIMTASVAALGFLPMALSTSAGAEVQKPLATVVIGGLLTATLLTLVVLPVLYYFFERGVRRPSGKVAVMLLGFLCFSQIGLAQNGAQKINSLSQAIDSAMANNLGIRAGQVQLEQAEAIKGSSWNLPKTDIGWMNGQYNSIYKNDNQFTITQKLEFPTVYASKNSLANSKIQRSELRLDARQIELRAKVKSAWYELAMLHSKAKLLERQDSLLRKFEAAAKKRFERGDTGLMDQSNAALAAAEGQLAVLRNEADISIAERKLAALLNLKTAIGFNMGDLKKMEFAETNLSIASNSALNISRKDVEISTAEKTVRKNELLPDIMVGYFNQSLNWPGQNRTGEPVLFDSADRFSGFSLGLSIPIFGAASQASAIKAASLQQQAALAESQNLENMLTAELERLEQEELKNRKSLDFYEATAVPQAALILDQAEKGYAQGAIGYLEYLDALNRALNVEFKKLEMLNNYNQTATELEALISAK